MLNEENKAHDTVVNFEPKSNTNNAPKKVENKINTKTTKKKVVRLGKQEYLDKETGEIKTFDLIESEENADFNWEKVWVFNLLQAMNAVGNVKVEITMWLMTNKNNDNHIIATQKHIAETLGVSLKSVNTTLKSLVDVGAISKVSNGVWMFNPEIMAYGSSKKRDGLIIQFTKSKVD